MRFIYGFDPDNAAGARQARTDFYALGNNGIQPDLSYVWSDVSSWYLTPGIIDQINHHVPYICVSYLDGKVAGVITEYQYLMPKDMHDALSDQYYDGDIDTCEVSLSESAMAAEHGTFTLVSPFTGTGGEVPLYTEVYINAVPDEGYRLKPGSLKVNG